MNSAYSVGRSALCILAIVVISTFVPAAIAQPADLANQVGAHLAAGEFGPALALAGQANDAAQRDQLMAAIALAQARGGARNAALQTTGSLADDRTRAGVLDQMSSQPVNAWPARGGGTMADFDTLIDLMTSTIAPQTWDVVGGPGAVDAFPGGVYVDASGLMKQIDFDQSSARNLAHARSAALEAAGEQDVRQQSQMRKISLTRLEKQLQLRAAQGKTPTDIMRHLAGMQRVRYVFAYPDTGDIILAGPAGDWTLDREGRAVSADGGVPVLNLDDFVVVLRNAVQRGGQFTCSINPKKENLAATQAFLQQPTSNSTDPVRRFRQIRDLMGKQDIEVDGIDARTRVARIIVEADYRMKLVGMGLEEPVFGVTSYLDSIEIPEGGAAPPMAVLRWWFTMNYGALQTTPTRDAFEIQGQGVKVQSENEMLNERGERVHTGQSDELNRKFADGFTKAFPSLATKYPIYAELRNVFDLALVASLMVAEDLPGQVGWHMVHLLDSNRYQVELGLAPTEVETVINHRVIRQRNLKHFVAGVSGGVSVNPAAIVDRPAIKVSDYGVLKAGHQSCTPPDLPHDAWWWD